MPRDTEESRCAVDSRYLSPHSCQQSRFRLWLSASASSKQPEYHAAPRHRPFAWPYGSRYHMRQPNQIYVESHLLAGCFGQPSAALLSRLLGHRHCNDWPAQIVKLLDAVITAAIR
ncbi:hypothetical protein Y032_0113g361 [Ancylostoma ceylanicum]|nr:hypothetical protein Y032_0113g361 [Ancylostoma ceylanicum]